MSSVGNEIQVQTDDLSLAGDYLSSVQLHVEYTDTSGNQVTETSLIEFYVELHNGCEEVRAFTFPQLSGDGWNQYSGPPEADEYQGELTLYQGETTTITFSDNLDPYGNLVGQFDICGAREY